MRKAPAALTLRPSIRRIILTLHPNTTTIMDKQNLQEHWNLLKSAQKLCLAQNLMTPEIIREVSATGGILMMSIGIVQARLAQIRLANQIPALPVAVLLAKLFL